MRIAIIENGIVTNVCEADAEWVAEHGGVETEVAGPGWLYDGVNFTQPHPNIAELKALMQAQIDAAERAQMMPRVTREALLGIALQQGATLGMTEAQMYAANIGYRKLKDFEASIVALRDQMAAIV